MDKINFGQRLNISNNTENIDSPANSSIANPDPFVGKVRLDAALIDEWPLEKSAAATGQMNETIVQEAPNGETIVYKDRVGERVVHEILKNGTGTAKDPLDEVSTHSGPVETDARTLESLLDRAQTEHFRTQWNEIQIKFVDEPQAAIQAADALVSDVIGQITQMFTREHSLLKNKWEQGNNLSTEDLHKILQRYHAYFNRLVV